MTSAWIVQIPLEILTPEGTVCAEPGDLLCSNWKAVWVLDCSQFNIGMLIHSATTSLEWSVERAAGEIQLPSAAGDSGGA